jgi:mannose-6-phosphate isomerase-like protein (cupin superfamily)
MASDTYTVVKREDAHDFMAQYPGFGEMRLFTEAMGCEQVAFTWRSMPPKTGGKGSYGHRHKTQEEIYFVISGTLQFKLDDDVIDVEPGTAVRIGSDVVRSVWNDGPGDAQLVMCSRKVDSAADEVVTVEDFWPVD